MQTAYKLSSTISVLIVEDEAIISMHISKIVERLGFDVCGMVSYGEEVIDAVEKFHPDLILMDIMLAGEMDGIQAADLVKQQHDIPIVYLTGNADRSTVEKARTTEPFGYLSKPVSERDVYAAIDTAIFKHNMELKLKESEERYRFLSEKSSDIIYRMSIPDGVYEYVSSASINLTGYKPEEYYNNPVLMKKYIHPDWRDYFKEQWRNLLKGDVPPTYEYQIITKSGETRWMNQRNTLLKDKKGKLIAIQGIVRDVTEMKDAMLTIEEQNKKLEAVNLELKNTMEELESTNEELRAAMEEQEAMNEELVAVNKMLVQSEQRYRQLFDTINTSVAVYDAVDDGKDFIIKQFNSAAERAENIERHKVLGKKVTEVFPGVEEFGLLEVFRRVWKTGESEDHPISLYNDNRIEGWKENHVYRLEHGEVVAVYNDITEQKKIEIALKESEEKYRLIAENLDIGLFISNPEGFLIHANKVLVDMFGYKDLNEALTVPIWEVYADQDERKEIVDILFDKGALKDHRVSFKKKDGSIFQAVINIIYYNKQFNGNKLFLGTVSAE